MFASYFQINILVQYICNTLQRSNGLEVSPCSEDYSLKYQPSSHLITSSTTLTRSDCRGVAAEVLRCREAFPRLGKFPPVRIFHSSPLGSATPYGQPRAYGVVLQGRLTVCRPDVPKAKVRRHANESKMRMRLVAWCNSFSFLSSDVHLT